MVGWPAPVARALAHMFPYSMHQQLLKAHCSKVLFKTLPAGWLCACVLVANFANLQPLFCFASA